MKINTFIWQQALKLSLLGVFDKLRKLCEK